MADREETNDRHITLIESEEKMDYLNHSNGYTINYTKGIYRKHIADLFKELLQQLPAELRVVIVGLYYDNLNETELAKMHNISQSTVNSRKHKAINRFAVMLAERGYTCEDFEL